jgi:hypothetical protein
MPDNVTANSGSGGAVFIAANFTFSGDSAYAPGCFTGILSGTEGAWTFTNIVGGAGAVTAGTQRMTLASDDPGVVALQAIETAVEGTLTVGLPTGASTAANQTTANTALSAIQTAVSAIQAGQLPDSHNVTVDNATLAVTQSGTWNVGNISGTVSLPTGASTAANQTTIIGHVDGIEALLGTIDADTGGILTSVQTLDDVVYADGTPDGSPKGAVVSGFDRGGGGVRHITVDSDGNVQVDIIAALPAGTNNIGDVDVLSIAAGDNNIGNVDIASAIPAGTNYVGKVRITDGTNDTSLLNLTNSKPIPVGIVDGDGTQITSFGGGTQYTEDAAAAANPVGTVPILVRVDTPAGAVSADGDNVAQRGSNFGAAYVTLVDNAGSFVSVGGGTQYDEDTAHVSGDKVTMAGVVRADTAAAQSGTDGDRTVLISDASGRLHVNVGNTVTVGSHAVTNAGTFAVQVDGSALTALQLIDDVVYAEDVAAQAGDKGVAILAVRRDADTSLVGADNDYANLQVDANGYLKVEIFDGGGSHTVDNAALSVVGGGAEATALRVTLASDSTGTLSVDDNGGSLTIDGTVAATQSGTWDTLAQSPPAQAQTISVKPKMPPTPRPTLAFTCSPCGTIR